MSKDLIGRTIFAKPSNKWLNKDIDDRALIKKVKENYRRLFKYGINDKIM